MHELAVMMLSVAGIAVVVIAYMLACFFLGEFWAKKADDVADEKFYRNFAISITWIPIFLIVGGALYFV